MLALIFVFMVQVQLVPFGGGEVRTEAECPIAGGPLSCVDPGPRTNPYLYHAEAGARWLISIAEEPAPGLYKWCRSDIVNSFYLEQSIGASGIGKFFLQLYDLTGNGTYLEYAEGAGRWLISQADHTAPDACRWTYVEGYPYYNPDYYGGNGVIVEYLLMLYQATDNSTYLEYSEKGANWLIDIAVPVGDGFKWETFPGGNYNMTGWYHGTAGIAYVLLLMYEETGNTTYLDHCLGGARWLMDIAMVPAPDEYTWVRVETDTWPMATWCGGTTGIVQFFLVLYESTGNGTYLDYAKGGGNWLISQSYEISPGNVSIFATNIFCHGDPSCAWILFWLYDATGNDTYLSYGEMTMNWLISQKEKVNDKEIKWPSLPGGDEYNTGLLMGVSGIGHAFILSHEIRENGTYMDLALKAANWVGNLSVEPSPGTEMWNYMEKVDSTEEYYTGWYWGVAGIGQFMLEVAPYWEEPPWYEVQITSYSSPIGLRPRSTSSYGITIMNSGDLVLTPNVTLTTPPSGWILDISFDDAPLSPSESRNGLMTVTPPKDARAYDTCFVHLTVTVEEDTSVLDSVGIMIVVEPGHGVHIVTEDRIGHAIPGETLPFEIEVENTGSMVDNVSVELSEQPSGWGVDISDPDGLYLDPAMVKTTYVNVTLESPLPPGENLNITIRARSGGDPDINDTMTITVIVTDLFRLEVLTGNLSGNVTPGSSASFDLMVRNTGNVDISDGGTGPWISLSEMDGGWDPHLSVAGEIRPGGIGNITISIVPPPEARAGEIGNVDVTFMSYPTVQDKEVRRITVIVGRVRGVEILTDDIESGPLDGDNVTYSVMIMNGGNDPDSVLLDCSGIPDGWIVHIDLNGTDMERLEVREAVVRIQRTFGSPVFASNITLSASIAGSPEISDGMTISLEFLPRRELVLSGNDTVSGSPGEVVKLDLTLRSMGNTLEPVRISISSGLGWDHQLPGGYDIADLVPYENMSFEVTVRIPEHSRAGVRDNISVNAFFISDPLRITEHRVGIIVLPVLSFEMTSDRNEISVRGDGSSEVDITISNTGNIGHTVDLSVGEGVEGWVHLSSDPVDLDLNGSAHVTLVIDPDGIRAGRYEITVIGRSGDEEKRIVLTVIITEERSEGPFNGAILAAILLLVLIVSVIAFLLYISNRRSKGIDIVAGDDPDDVWGE